MNSTKIRKIQDGLARSKAKWRHWYPILEHSKDLLLTQKLNEQSTKGWRNEITSLYSYFMHD